MKIREAKLSEILELDLDEEVVNPKKEYLFAGVYSFGRGLFKRDYLKGDNTSYPVFNKLHKDRIVLSKVKGWEGALALVTEEFEGLFLSPVFLTFKAKRSDVDLNYINFFLRCSSVWNELFFKSTGLGARRNNVSEEQFLSLSVPFPPLPVQKVIVNKLEGIKGKCGQALQLRLLAEKEVEALKLSMLNDIFKHPGGYEVMTVGEVCNPAQYGFSASSTRKNTGVRLVRISDIQQGKVNWETVPFCYCNNAEPYLLKENDILFARTGGTTGKSFLVRDVPENSIFASYLIRVTANDNILPEYLYLFFQCPLYWDQIFEGKRGTGQPNFNSTKLQNIKLPVPPIPEQERIIEEVNTLSNKIHQIKNYQQLANKELKAIFPSVLDKAFKGEW